MRERDCSANAHYASRMRIRRLLAVTLFFAAHAFAAAAASLLPGDAVAFRTVIDDRFPGRKGTIYVAESSYVSMFDTTAGVTLRGSDLGPHVTFVTMNLPRDVVRNELHAMAAFVFRLPVVDKEK